MKNDKDTVEVRTTLGNILIVDDNPVNLNLLSNMLVEQSYKVRVANSGQKALMSINIRRPDLILLDINMPEMDGYEVCRLLKADNKLRDIPIIFVSALDDVIDKVKAFKVGGIDYITKPIQVEEVMVRIETQLQLVHLHKELINKNKELASKNDELIRKNDELIRSQEELNKSYIKANRIYSALTQILHGTILDDKYKLEGKIGEGGYGTIYQASNLELKSPVAIKIFRPQADNFTPAELESFRLEGMSASRINHPNVVNIYDFCISSLGIVYLVMELLEGHTLEDEISDKGHLSLARCAEILLPICSVLSEAHTKGIIHRDIKPSNIFLHQSKTGEVVKLLDFGIAKLIGDDGSKKTTTSVVGTPIYMPPERLNGLPYDGKADIYSLGIMLYEMLSGQVPFDSLDRNVATIAMMHIMKEPEPLSKLVPNVPSAIEHIVMRTLRKDPSLRPTAKELSQDFLEGCSVK